MTPPTYIVQSLHTLKPGACFMPMPQENTLGPCIRIAKIQQDGWNLTICGEVIAIPTQQKTTKDGVILHKGTRFTMGGTEIAIGEEVELTLPQDTKIAVPNPELTLIIKNTIKNAVCRDGKVLITFTCPSLPEKWKEHFHQIIIENMAQRNLHLTELEKRENAVSGIVNTIPGHPLHHDRNLTFTPLPALTIHSAIQPCEEKGAKETILEFCQKESTIQKVDGEWMVNLHIQGLTHKAKLANLAALQAKLAEQFLQLDANDPAEPICKHGHFHGFICRHPDTAQQISKIWEGKALNINL